MKHLFLNGPQWIALRTVSVSGCNIEGGEVVVVGVRLGSAEQTRTVNHPRARPQVEQHHGESYMLMEGKRRRREPGDAHLWNVFSREKPTSKQHIESRAPPPGVSPTITHAPLDVAAPRLSAPDADTPPTAPLAATAACVRLRGEEVVPSCHAPVIICVQTAPGLVTAK